MRSALFGKTLPELERVAAELSLPSYAGRQMAEWLYDKNVDSIAAMTNLSKSGRALLSQRYVVGRAGPRSVTVSTDGTKKYLYGAGPDGGATEQRYVEAACIPDSTRHTLCLSTQVGCRMGCLFCMTGKQGFQGQLTAGEVVNQYASLPERDRITNIVYMGMGEPLDNVEAVLGSLEILTERWGYGMSPERITVSTIGILPGIKELLARSRARLAISVHSPFEEERQRLMPVEHVYPLRDVLDLLRASDLGGRRVSLEYIVFGGLNHSPAHVKELSRLVQGLKVRINLIYFHSIPDTPLRPATDGEMVEFQERLKAKGIRTTIRASRGQDVQAACGLLSTRGLVRQPVEDF